MLCRHAPVICSCSGPRTKHGWDRCVSLPLSAQVMEAQNHDYEAKYEEWYLRGKLGDPPRCSLLHIPLNPGLLAVWSHMLQHACG